MINKNQTCDELALKIMALVDDELPEDEKKQICAHIKTCTTCAREYASLTKLKGVTGEMKMKKLPEFYWDEYWQHIYNRIERGISWLLISIGTIIILGYVLWQALGELIADEQINPLVKGGIFILLIGVLILLVSVIREKIMVRKVDRYREVER
jgi:hypothetical protein